MSNTVQAGIDTPRVVYVPEQILQLFEMSNIPVSELICFRTLVETIGDQSLANFIFFNSLYNSKSDIFLPSEVITGIDCVDLYELLYRTAVLADAPHDYMLDVKRLVDAKIANVTTLTREDLVPTLKVEEGEQERYYVPRLFIIRDNIYGVRLEAITDYENLKEELRKVTVANLGILSVRYDVRQWAKTDLFKDYVELC